MITGGENTRFGFRELIEKQTVDVLQPDIYRAGGIMELRKIAAMAARTTCRSSRTVTEDMLARAWPGTMAVGSWRQ